MKVRISPTTDFHHGLPAELRRELPVDDEAQLAARS